MGRLSMPRMLSLLGRKHAIVDVARSDLDGRTAAAAALLIEAALREDIPEQERACVVEVLVRKYSLTADQAETCLATAIASKAEVDRMSCHLSTVAADMDDPGKFALIEAMWAVAYADGVLTDGEISLIESVAAMIGVTARQCEEARALSRAPGVAVAGE